MAQLRGLPVRVRLPGQGERGQAERAAGVRRGGRRLPDGGRAGGPALVLQRLRPARPARSPAPGSPTSTPTRTTRSSHYETTGPELWEQTDGRITHFVAGVGTGGTISGIGRYLKEVSGGAVQVIGADPEGSVYSGGTGRPYLVEGVGEDFWPRDVRPRRSATRSSRCPTRTRSTLTRRLAREEGLLVGGSCGMAVAAALEVAAPGRPGRRRRGAAARRRARLPVEDLQRRLDGPVRLPGHAARPGATVADVLAARAAGCRELVHVHPTETVRDAIDYMREYGVSQLPVLKAEPPVVTGEVAGSIAERDLLDALFTGQAHLHDMVERHMGPPLPMIGGGQPVSEAVALLEKSDAAMVLVDGKPAGVLTRQDLLGFLGARRP